MAQQPSNRRRRAVRRALLALGVLAIALAWPLSRAGTALVVERDTGAPDAIIMLASHEWERLPAAAALARQNPGAIVLITIPKSLTVYTCHRCGERVAWFEAEGVPEERIRTLGPVANTFEEALAAREHARREAITRLAVVTSPYHTRRALATFRTVFAGSGIEISSVPAAPAEGRPTRWWAAPYDRFYVRYEWAAIIKYRFTYGVGFSAASD